MKKMTGCILLILFLAAAGTVLAEDAADSEAGLVKDSQPSTIEESEPASGAVLPPVTIAVMDFESLNCPEELVQEFRRRIHARILWHERTDLHVVMVSSSDEEYRKVMAPPSLAVLGLESYIVELAQGR
ncbi:MAG: hypothetical protein SVR04_03965 [Spirochaetota bacterium]|nr:hypothetical protein [Spirochaetota bacterium]